MQEIPHKNLGRTGDASRTIISRTSPYEIGTTFTTQDLNRPQVTNITRALHKMACVQANGRSGRYTKWIKTFDPRKIIRSRVENQVENKPPLDPETNICRTCERSAFGNTGCPILEHADAAVSRQVREIKQSLQ